MASDGQKGRILLLLLSLLRIVEIRREHESSIRGDFHRVRCTVLVEQSDLGWPSGVTKDIAALWHRRPRKADLGKTERRLMENGREGGETEERGRRARKGGSGREGGEGEEEEEEERKEEE